MGSHIIGLYSEVIKVKGLYYRLKTRHNIYKFTKQGYFIVYTEEISAEDIVQIYIKEIFVKYRVLIKIILDRDTRFILIFW